MFGGIAYLSALGESPAVTSPYTAGAVALLTPTSAAVSLYYSQIIPGIMAVTITAGGVCLLGCAHAVVWS